MKDQYIGDIGDYGKYGLLRYLISNGINIGVNWYYTENDGTGHGSINKYLNNENFRKYDEKLYDYLKTIAFNDDKELKMIENSGLFGNTAFFGECVDIKDRNNWFERSVKKLSDKNLIFCDPDNGILGTKNKTAKDSDKYIFPEEIEKYYTKGKNIVYYCQRARRTEEKWKEALYEMRSLPDSRIFPLIFHKGTQRAYIFVVHKQDAEKYEKLLTDFVSADWGELFEKSTNTPDPNTIHPIMGYDKEIYVKPTVKNPNIIVGEFTYIADSNFESHVTHHYDFIGDKLIIGKFCQIAAGVEFVMNGANHQINAVSTFPFYTLQGWNMRPPEFSDLPIKGDTIIGNDVWIGQNATVLPGVHIGDGAIIGANSVVGSDIPPYTIVAGNPARELRKRFDNELIDLMLKFRWWDKSIDEINSLIPLLTCSDLERVKRELKARLG